MHLVLMIMHPGLTLGTAVVRKTPLSASHYRKISMNTSLRCYNTGINFFVNYLTEENHSVVVFD